MSSRSWSLSGASFATPRGTFNPFNLFCHAGTATFSLLCHNLQLLHCKMLLLRLPAQVVLINCSAIWRSALRSPALAEELIDRDGAGSWKQDTTAWLCLHMPAVGCHVLRCCPLTVSLHNLWLLTGCLALKLFFVSQHSTGHGTGPESVVNRLMYGQVICTETMRRL